MAWKPLSKEEDFVRLWLRWAFNTILLLVLLVVTGITVAGLATVASLGFWQGFSLSATLQLALVLVTFFVAVRVVIDSVKLFDRFARTLLSRIPIVYGHRGPKRLLIEVVMLVGLSLFSNLALSFLSAHAPDVVPFASLLMSVVIMVLAYDVSKALYLMIEAPIHSFAKMVTERSERSENEE